ncbi:MAG: FtsQ-type POTRA domain-containing protein [Candidatus Cloacimonetes bacterium]|nr:FtsQ-type POTRA domain-containing protein [Candidatus Cloacimonadota bacterium]
MELTRKRRGNSRFFITFFVLALGLAFSFWGLRALSRRIEWFRIDRVTIQGRHILPEAFCVSLSEEYVGQNLFDISTSEVAQRYERLARVKSCRVHRIPPSRLSITIVERRTAFWLQRRDGALLPVDAERVILDSDVSYAHEDAPLVNLGLDPSLLVPGDTLRNDTLESVFALHGRIAASSDWLANRVSQYYLDEEQLTLVETGSGCRIVLGEGNMDEKLRRLLFFAENKGFTPGATLDLRFHDQIVAKMGVR